MEAAHAIQRRYDRDPVSETISRSLKMLSLNSTELLVKYSQNPESSEHTDSKIALSLATYYFIKQLNEELQKSGKHGDVLLEYNMAANVFRLQGFEHCSAGKFDLGQGLSGDPRFLVEYFIDLHLPDPAHASHAKKAMANHGMAYMHTEIEAGLVQRKRE